MRGATTRFSCQIREPCDDGGYEKAFEHNFARKISRKLVDALVPLVAPRRLLFLQGALGTGKTEIARALIQKLAQETSEEESSDEETSKEETSEEETNDEATLVPSPTFAILQPYETKRTPVLHADLYRLQPTQTRDLGLEEALQRGFVMIEWAERLDPALRARLLKQAALLRLRLAYSADASERSAVLTLPQSLATKALHELGSHELGLHDLQSLSGNSGQKDKAESNAEIFESKKSERRPRRHVSFSTRPDIRHAFVLAAGLGKRMRAYAQKPKPLLDVGGKALLLRIIERLRAQGVAQIFVNAHYRADAIVAACEGLAGVVVLKETRLLETGGSIERALPLLGEQPFFALNADTLWYDPPAQDGRASSSLLACLAEGWQILAQSLPQEKREASALLALVKEQGAKDMQASLRPSSTLEAHEPFPLVFPVPPCEHAEDRNPCFRYIGVQILTARAFRFMSVAQSVSKPVSKPVSHRPMPYSLKRLYAHEADAGRLFGLAVEEEWQGRWLHVGDRASLARARRTWKGLVAQV